MKLHRVTTHWPTNQIGNTCLFEHEANARDWFNRSKAIARDWAEWLAPFSESSTSPAKFEDKGNSYRFHWVGRLGTFIACGDIDTCQTHDATIERQHEISALTGTVTP